MKDFLTDAEMEAYANAPDFLSEDDFARLSEPRAGTPTAKRDFLQKAGDFFRPIGNFTGGNKIGESLGTIAAAGGRLFKGDTQGARDIMDTQVPVSRLIGDYGKAFTTVASAGLPLSRSFLGSAAQFGALGAAQGLSQGLSEGRSARDTAVQTAGGAATSAVLGGVFNLLGKAASATSKAAGSFTSGVPSAALERASQNPDTAKQGVRMSLDEIHTKATDALAGLQKNLTDEFQTGLQTISPLPAKPVPSPLAIQTKLIDDASKIAKDFRVGVLPSTKGATGAFNESALVKGGEQSVVNETLRTIGTWTDFSPVGMQDLAERVGALRNFESGTQTKASPIVGKIYNKIADDLIPTYYPDLKTLRTNFSNNKTVLDEINAVLNATSEKPTQIQGAVSRLDTLFKENRETYLNVIKNLSDRSGTDILSLLAGNEFQKVLPGFVRGLGGAGAISVGASVLNPWLILLSPLFSPRAVGTAALNSKAIQNAVGLLERAGTTQQTPRLFQSGKTSEE